MEKTAKEYKKILVTGFAGFIGYHVTKRLLEFGVDVVGVDNFNDYYDVRLKEWRADDLKKKWPTLKFYKLDIEDKNALTKVFQTEKFDAVINLAARAGVRASIENPKVYVTTNILGTLNLLDLCRDNKIKKFVMASTSSLYAGKKMPFREDDAAVTPISPYAASKGGAEGMAYSYHHMYGIDITIPRYFTVYGEAGRPDMSIFRFIRWIMNADELQLNGDGSQSRDFTYVGDIVEGTILALKKVGFEIINLGGDSPHSMKDVIGIIERETSKKAKIKKFPFPREDVKETWADISKAKKLLGWTPKVSLADGLKRTIKWVEAHWNFVKGLEI